MFPSGPSRRVSPMTESSEGNEDTSPSLGSASPASSFIKDTLPLIKNWAVIIDWEDYRHDRWFPQNIIFMPERTNEEMVASVREFGLLRRATYACTPHGCRRMWRRIKEGFLKEETQ